jgi:hypothetical protein
MEHPPTAPLRSGIEKLALIGHQAGFTTEQMIELLNAGIGVETLLDVISWRLQHPTPLARVPRSSEWVV